MRLRHRHRPDTSTLSSIGLDEALTTGQLVELARHTDVLRVPRGEVLGRTGQVVRQYLHVVDGYVDVTDGDGHTHVAGPGTDIGGIELLDRSPLQHTVIARSDCTLVVIFGPALTAAVATSPPATATIWSRSVPPHDLGAIRLGIRN